MEILLKQIKDCKTLSELEKLLMITPIVFCKIFLKDIEKKYNELIKNFK